MMFRSGIAVAVAEASRCSSDSTPSLGNSVYHRYGSKKKREKKKKPHICMSKASMYIKKSEKKLLLWLNWVGSVLVAAGIWVGSPAQHSGLEIRHCHHCGLVHDWGSDLNPGLAVPYAKGKPKIRKKKKSENILQIVSNDNLRDGS